MSPKCSCGPLHAVPSLAQQGSCFTRTPCCGLKCSRPDRIPRFFGQPLLLTAGSLQTTVRCPAEAVDDATASGTSSAQHAEEAEEDQLRADRTAEASSSASTPQDGRSSHTPHAPVSDGGRAEHRCPCSSKGEQRPYEAFRQWSPDSLAHHCI